MINFTFETRSVFPFFFFCFVFVLLLLKVFVMFRYQISLVFHVDFDIIFVYLFFVLFHFDDAFVWPHSFQPWPNPDRFKVCFWNWRSEFPFRSMLSQASDTKRSYGWLAKTFWTIIWLLSNNVYESNALCQPADQLG